MARLMVRRLAPHLGLDPGTVPLRVHDADQAGPLGGARAAANADGIRVRPSALADPDPALFAHELAHLAQHRNRSAAAVTRGFAQGVPGRRPSVTEAEAEAAALADAARHGLPLWRPRALLPDGHLARDSGSTGVMPARPADAGPGNTPDPGVPPLQPAQDTGKSAATQEGLKEIVKRTHAAELDRIAAEMSSFWDIAADKRDYVLGLLDQVPFVVAKAMASTLDPDQRQRLAQLSDQDHQRHPAAAVAVLAALDTSDTDALGDKLTKGRFSALHGLRFGPLEPTALRALYGFLRTLTSPQLLQLIDGDRRGYFREQLAMAPPEGSDQDALESAYDSERAQDKVRQESIGGSGTPGGSQGVRTDPSPTQGVDIALIERLTKLLADHNAEQARLALDALASVAVTALPGQPGQTKAGQVQSAAGAAGGPASPAPGANAPIEPGRRLRAIVTELDRLKLVDVILDELPAADRYLTETPASYGTILSAVLAARAPGLTLPRIESLLSYGIFDWAITDGDAKFAYLLVRSLPVTVQDEWRQRDDGKWFRRLEDNLPEELVTKGTYTGVGTEFTGSEPAKHTDAAVLDLLTDVMAIWRHRNEQEAASVISRLSVNAEHGLTGKTAVRDASAVPAKGAPAEEAPAEGAPAKEAPAKEAAPASEAVPAKGAVLAKETVTAVVRRLDALGLLEDILWELSVDYITSLRGRHAVDSVAALRDPEKNEMHAVHLLSTGLFDWWISSHEAWLARLLLRALPPDRQIHFQKAHPDMWSDMEAALTPAMRASDANQALTGRDGFPTLAELRDKLSDKTLWDAAHAERLRALIDLAYASDDRAFVFELSYQYRDRLASLGRLVDDLGLYDEASGRTTYVPETLDVPASALKIFSFLAGAARFTVFAAGPFMQLVSSSFGYTMHVDVDLDEAQWAMGGDIKGAQFTKRAEPEQRPRAATADTAGLTDEFANRLRVDFDPGAGIVRMSLPHLRLDRINIATPGASYRVGAVDLRGLEVVASFSDRHYRKPIGAELTAAKTEVADLVVGDPALTMAAADVDLTNVNLTAGQTGAEDLGSVEPRPGTIYVPVFGPLFQALKNIVALWGGIPGDYTLLDVMALPFTSGLPFLQSEIIQHVTDAAVPTPQPVSLLWGLATDGTLRPPRDVATRMADAARMLRSLQISFTDLTITGLSLGAKTQIASLSLHDVNIGVARSRPAYLRAQIASLQRRIDLLTGPERDQAAAAKKALEDELVGLLTDEANLATLEHKDRWIAGSLTEQERTGRTVGDQGRAGTARDTAGGLGTPGAGHAAGMAALNAELRSDAGVVADIGSIEVGEVTGGVNLAGARLGRAHLELRVPAAEIMRRLRLASPEIAGVYLDDKTLVEQFRQGGPEVRLPDEVAKSAEADFRVDSVQLLTPRDGGPVLRIPMAGGSLDVQSVTTGPITGGFDPKSRTLTARLTDIQAAGVSGPGGYGAEKISGAIDLTLSLTEPSGPAGDTAGMAALATRLKAGLGLDLTAEAVRTPLGIIQRVAVAGLTAEGQKTKDGLELTGVHADAISLRDLNLTAFGRAVTGTGVLIENVSLAGTVGDGVVSVPLVTIGQISGDELRFLSTEAGSQLDVRITHGVLGVVQLTGLTWQPDGQVTGSLTAGTISDVSYTVVTGLFTGTGVLGMASGTGPGQAAPGPGADALRVGFSRGPDHTSITLDAHGLAAIGNHFSSPDGALTVDRTLIDLHGELHDGDITTTLTLSDTEIGAVRWQSGPMSITSPRGTRIKSLTAAVRYLAAQQSSTDPARRTARLLVDNLTIDDFGMSDLHYHDAGQNPPLDIWLGRDAPHPGALQVSRIRLSGFVLPFDAEGHALAGQAAGSIAVTGTQLDARAVQGTFKASGSIDVRSITVEFSQGGKVLTVRGQGIGGDVHVQTPGLDISGQLPVGEFGGADTGTIRVTPEAIEVKGFRIPYLSLDALEVRGTEAGGPWLRMLEGGGIYVTELEADIRIDRWRPGEKHPPAQPFRRIGLTHAEIEQIDAEGFEFGYPPLGLSITVPVGPAGEKASAASIRLLKLEGQGPDGFILTPGGPDSPVGTLSADSFQIPGLRANIEKRFSGLGQVSGGNLTVGFLAHGMTVVDLNDLTAAAEEGTLGGPGETIAVQRIGVQHAHVAGGKAEVTGLTLHRLQYHRAGMDVEADAEVPGKAEFGAHGAKIPKLHIGHGHLVVKFRDLSASSPASGTPDMIPSPRTLTYMLMDRLQGEVPLTVQVRGKHIPHFDLRDIDIRTTVRFDHGKLDLPDLRKQFTDSAIIDPPSGYLSSQVKSARFDLEEGSRLVFHTTVTPQQTLFAWRLEPADVELYQKEQKLRLSSAIIELIPDSANPPRSLTIVLGPATNLSVKNDAPIPVSFSYPGFWGDVVLGRDVLVGLAAQGSITPVDTSGPGTGSLSGIKLEHFTIDQTRLWAGENLITTEAIHIVGARDGMLSLSRTDPIELTLWIDSADAENITWSRP